MKGKWRVFPVAAVLAVGANLAGLLGGCGSSHTTTAARAGGAVTVSVKWPATSARSRFIPAAANSIVVIVETNGSPTVTATVTRPQTTCTLTNVPVGTVSIKAAAYASTDGSGTALATGTVTGVVVANNQTTQAPTLTMLTTITTVTVSPSAPTVAAGSGTTLTASATDANSDVVLVAPAVWQWSSSSTSLATVTGSGTDNTATVTGVAAGNPIITAKDAEDATAPVSGTASLTVTPGTAKWTVMIYLDASNDLDSYGVVNVEQLEQLPNNADVNFVVLMKREWTGNNPTNDPATGVWTDARYFKIANHPNDTGMISSLLPAMGGTATDAGNVDMGSPATVRNFITWAVTNYPAQHYALDLWDHGSGVVQGYASSRHGRDVCYDDQTGSDLTTAQMSQAIGASPVLDIVMCDACNLAMPEVAYQVANCCTYFVGSEDATPGLGYPYNLIFANLAANGSETPASVCGDIVTQFTAFYQASGANQTAATQAALTTSGLPALCSAIGSYGAALTAKDATLHSQINTARAASTTFNDGYPTSSYEDYHDLVDFINRVNIYTGDSTLATAGAQVTQALTACLLAQGHTTLETSPCYGVAIYAPTSTWWPYERAEYEATQFAINYPAWPNWIDTFTGVR
jgi:hypothetical protein